MRILLIEPLLPPREVEILGTLESMQALVGGTIQAVFPFEDPIALICNDDGKLLNLPLNRALRNPDNGEIYDVVAGAFFLCGAPPDAENFTDLTPDQVTAYMAKFHNPEQFILLNGHLLAFPTDNCHD